MSTMKWVWYIPLLLGVILGGVAGDLVYLHSGSYYGQLVTSSTLRWVRGHARDPATLPKPQDNLSIHPGQQVICRLIGGSKDVGVVQEDSCLTSNGKTPSDKFQTITGSASRLLWTPWRRPNPPPAGAVAAALKPQKFLAAHPNTSAVGVLDPASDLGTAFFGRDHAHKEGLQESQEALILIEIEPHRYELTDLKMSRDRTFSESEVTLGFTQLRNEGEVSQDESLNRPQKMETVLAYESSTYDYWGQGGLMVKGLHTAITLPPGSIEVMDEGNHIALEWGIPLVQTGKMETVEAFEMLEPGTGVNITLKGTKLDGGMPYEATLRTIFRDGGFSLRPVDGHRKVEKTVNIRLEITQPYFLSNGSLVPDPPTPTTVLTTSTTTPSPPSSSSTTPQPPSSSQRGDSAALPREMQRDIPESSGNTSPTIHLVTLFLSTIILRL